jgi:hypothetical protein
MPRPVKPATLVTLHEIDRGIASLKVAREHFRDAGCPRTVLAISRAIASAEGARRHCERRIAATENGGRYLWLTE